MSQADPNPPDAPPAKPWAPHLLPAAAISLACLTLYLYAIAQFPDDDYKPDDTAALLAAFGNQDEFDIHFGQSPDPVVITAAKVKTWMTQPDPAGLKQTLQNLRRTDVHPPAYFIVLRYWAKLTGSAYPGAAALNAVIMALTIAVLTVGALRCAAPPAIIPTLLFATSTGACSAAMEIRPNALAALGLAVAAVAAMPILNDPPNAKRPYLIAIAAGSILAAYSQYLSGPVIALLFILLAVRAASPKHKPTFRRIAFTAIATAVAVAPLLPTLSDQMTRLQSVGPTSKPAQPDPPTPMRWQDSVVCLALNASAFPRPAGQSKAILVAAVLIAIAAIALFSARKTRDLPALAVVTFIAVALIPWLVHVGKLSPHVLQPKYYTGFTALLCVLLAAPWARRPARWITILWIAAFVPLIALNLAADKRPIKRTFTTALSQKDNQDLATADVVLIQSIPRQRRLLVLPIAAKTNHDATLIVGNNAQLTDLIRTGNLPSAPNGKYFYCAPYGKSRSFQTPKTP